MYSKLFLKQYCCSACKTESFPKLCAVLVVIVTHTLTSRTQRRSFFGHCIDKSHLRNAITCMHACDQKLTDIQNLRRCVKSLSNVCNPRVHDYVCVRALCALCSICVPVHTCINVHAVNLFKHYKYQLLHHKSAHTHTHS